MVRPTSRQLTSDSLHVCIGEGNGSPLQCSCLEDPRDGGAWRAAGYGVAQSQTRPKRPHSSSSSARSVVSDSLWPSGLQPTRLLCPWDPPGKNTAVGCHSLLQGSSWPRNQTWVFCIAGRFSAIWATRGALTAAILRALKRKEHQITRGPNTECRFWPKDTGSGSRFRAGWFEWLWWTQGKGLSSGQLSLRMAGGGDRGPGCEREDPRLRAWPQGHWFAYEWLSLGINSLKKGTPSRVSKAPGVKASENTEKIRLFKNTSSATRLILFCHKF